MSILWLLAEIPPLVLETVVIGMFLLIFFLLLLIAFIPAATDRILRVLFVLRCINDSRNKYYPEQQQKERG